MREGKEFRKWLWLTFPLLKWRKLNPLSFPLLLTVPGYRWSADLGLCDTSSDTHTAHLYPEPWQCEQAETQNKLDQTTELRTHCKPMRRLYRGIRGLHITKPPGTRYRAEPGADRQQTQTHQVYMHADFQTAFKTITQLMTIIFRSWWLWGQDNLIQSSFTRQGTT